MNYLDTETFNDVPIKHGTYKYTSTCEPMIVTYALGGTADIEVWDITSGDPMPHDLAWVLDDPDEIFTAHSAMFDRLVIQRPPISRIIPIPRWRCTMVKAMCHGLPGGLDVLCSILNIADDKAKIKDGRRLINLFCKPQPKNYKLRRATCETHPEDWQKFIEYAKSDIASMREADRKIPIWNYRDGELALWHLDQKINDRGLCVDAEFARAAIAAVEKEQAKLSKETRVLTRDEVEKTTQRDRLLAHILKQYGIELPDMQMATLERRIADPDLPQELRELLAIRLAASSTSTGKYNSLLRGVQPDHRLRGTLQFAGAARTRRWAGRTFQPQNMPRPDLPTNEINFGIECINTGAEDLLIDDVMRLTRNAIRGCIVAPPEKKLVIADLANIEGRLGAWCGNVDWKLRAFRDYDRGEGTDLYCVAYAKAFNTTTEEVIRDKEEGGVKRQIGKVMELMLQYEGGVGAFITGADTYNIDLDAMTDAAWPTLPQDVLGEAHGMWKWSIDTKRNTFGLSQRVFETCDSLKRLWRRAHPGITGIWAELKESAINAINNPGNTFDCGMFKLRRDGAWLRILLPSGCYLCYPSPQVSENGTISYMGMNQYTKRWSRITTYGGKFFENICQALAGDVLKSSMLPAEAAGYEIVLTVHDEIVSETPDTKDFSAKALSAIMASPRPWTTGLPLAAAGFETYRYRKE